jgi:hypothetical protein
MVERATLNDWFVFGEDEAATTARAILDSLSVEGPQVIGPSFRFCVSIEYALSNCKRTTWHGRNSAHQTS